MYKKDSKRCLVWIDHDGPDFRPIIKYAKRQGIALCICRTLAEAYTVLKDEGNRDIIKGIILDALVPIGRIAAQAGWNTIAPVMREGILVTGHLLFDPIKEISGAPAETRTLVLSVMDEKFLRKAGFPSGVKRFYQKSLLDQREYWEGFRRDLCELAEIEESLETRRERILS